MSRTTPGPQTKENCWGVIVYACGCVIGVIESGYMVWCPLHAKAPELRDKLRALVTACDWLDEDSDDPAERRAYMDAVDDARALLAELEGGG